MDDDMLATPIGKIPPPMLQNNKDNAPVTAQSYDDLRNSVTIPRPEDNNPIYQQMPAQPQLQPQMQQQQMHQQQYDFQQPTYYEQAVPQQHQQHQQQQQQLYEYDYPRYAPSAAAALKKKKKRSASLFSVETLKRKDAWLFAIMLFAVIWYGLPKLRSTFPSIVDPLTGTTSTPALAALSLASGLVFTFINEAI